MKPKTYKKLFTILISVLVTFSALAQQGAQMHDVQSDLVGVYYFHFNTRCETCRAVESEAQLSVQLFFGDDVKFSAINLDEKEGEEIGKKLGVNSQMLLIVKGDEKINITNEGFLYALTDPDKFKEIIKEKIEALL